MITNGYQTFDTQTSISARNLSYQNRYVLDSVSSMAVEEIGRGKQGTLHGNEERHDA